MKANTYARGIVTAALAAATMSVFAQGIHPQRFKHLARAMSQQWYASTEARQAADSAMRHFNSEYRYKRITDYQFAAVEIRSMMTVKAWEKAINACGGYNFQQPAQNAEAAVAACIRAGLDKQTQLHYHNDWYRLQLNNQKYHVFREISGYTALPAPTRFTYYCHRSSIAFSGEEFADFLYSFDALVPDIRKV